MKAKIIYVLIFCTLFVLIFIFGKNSQYIVNKVELSFFKADSVSVLSFGDVMFDRGVRNIIENRKRDPFEYIKNNLDILKKYDVVSVNLEGPIVVMDRDLCQQKAYNFQFAPDATDRLKNVGINMVNIANNHSYDCYSQGFESTKKYLMNAGIDYMGDTEVEKSFVLKNINTKKVAFVGIDRTVSSVSISKYYDLIRKLKSENDFVVVNIHWGTEYSKIETDSQIVVAHGLIDAGTDVIFGHHPHVVEPVRIYKGKAIFYSLGNFVFDQVGVDENTGIGAGVEFGEDHTTINILPFKIKLFAPDFITGESKTDFCNLFLKDIVHSGCSFKI